MARVHALCRRSTLALRQRRKRLLRQLHLPPHLMRASVVERFNTCGQPNCACIRGQKHGPFYYLKHFKSHWIVFMKPNASDPAHGTQQLQPRRSRRVRCSAWCAPDMGVN